VIDEIVERVWPGANPRVEVLGGGITNRNFRVDVGGKSFVLRIGGKDTELLGIDRAAEYGASVAAAEIGVGPEVVAFLEPEGYLVTRFVEGENGRIDPARAGTTLRAVHAGPRFPGRFNPFRVVEAYAATALAHGVHVPPAYHEAQDCAARIERRLGQRPVCPCHNDLLNANFIDDGERIRIVDWEYAGMGDPYFDLGNFAVNHQLDEAGEDELLAAYGGDDRETLMLMRFMSDFREAMWGVVQQGISELDFDFRAYADEHFQRLERAASEPRFRRALD
jgi:thiamine kinase-like enzyme